MAKVLEYKPLYLAQHTFRNYLAPPAPGAPRWVEPCSLSKDWPFAYSRLKSLCFYSLKMSKRPHLY